MADRWWTGSQGWAVCHQGIKFCLVGRGRWTQSGLLQVFGAQVCWMGTEKEWTGNESGALVKQHVSANPQKPQETRHGFIFAGDWSNALILINQIKRLLPKSEDNAFSERCSGGWRAADNGKDDLIQLNVHLTFPLKRKLYSETGDNGFKFTGKDARSIVNWLIDETHHIRGRKPRACIIQVFGDASSLNRHEIEDARSVLNARMEKSRAWW